MAPGTTNGEASSVRRNKSIIVTGGASGIGRAMVSHFASQGHDVAVLDIDSAAGTDLVNELSKECPAARMTFHKCDVSSWDSQATAFEAVYQQHSQRIDIVMANAGISEQGSSSMALLPEEAPSKPSFKVLDVNLAGTIYSVKLAAHYMMKNHVKGPSRGSIICTASNAGLYPFPVAPLYAATKAGVIGLVRSMARPLAGAGVQINALAPAVLETNISPDRTLLKHMIITPMSTLISGVDMLLGDPTYTGVVAEIHGSSATFRPPHEHVDEDTAANLETFWTLGYA